MLTLAALIVAGSASAQVSTNLGCGGAVGSSFSISASSAVPAGGAIVVGVHVTANTNPPNGVTDSAGNTYTLATSRTGNFNDSHYVYVASGISPLSSGQSITVGWSFSNAIDACAIAVSEIAAASPVDRTANANALTTNANSGTTATTIQADEVLVGATTWFNFNGATTATAGSGYTKIAERTAGTNAAGVMLETRTVSATGTYNATATLNAADDWIASITTLKVAPDLKTSKSSNAGSPQFVSVPFTWTAKLSNEGPIDAVFTSGQTIFTDNLPNTNMTYGTPTVTNVTNVTNSGNISCTITTSNLVCTASGASVTIGSGTGSFDVQFTATPTATGTFTNPRGGGVCKADPNGVIDESDESNNASTNSVVVTAPNLSINDVTVTEGNAGTVNAMFTVSLSQSSGATVSVNYATADDTAVAPGDYTAITSTGLTFAPGQTSKTVTVVVNGDTIDEGASERFFVNLSSPTNATISDSQGIGTITDDDTTTISINDVTVTEGNSGTVNADFTVSLSTANSSNVTVNYATADDTATAPSDYTAITTTTLTFTPGQTSKTVTVVVNGDTVDEGTSERFFVNLSSGSSTITDNQGIGTITDDDITVDSDGSLTAAAGVTEPVGIGTTIDTVGEALNVFDFTLSDGGTADALPMTVSQIVIHVSGTSTDGERGQITWRLNGPDASNVVGVYSAPLDTLTFSGLSISVADGGSETYTINAYFNNNAGVVEGHTIILSVDGDTDLTVGGAGTQMGTTAAVTNGAGSTIDVVATTLAFATQPAGSVSGIALTTQPIVAARDAFGNTDVHFSNNVTLTEASAGALSGTTTLAPSSGVATFTNVVYTATADQETFALTAAATGVTSATSNTLTSDVVATKLIFATQPAPTSIISGSSTAFSTVPVVRAVDANDTVDAGYSTGIILSVTDPVDAILDGTVNSLTGTGDTDGSGVTVTLTPSSGVATYTGLTIQYTNGGGTDTIALRATSGGLTAVNSSSITSNALPVVTDGSISISGATGTGGAFRIGDTVTATWNNTGTGDNNTGILGVTVDFSQFGGGASVAAVNTTNTWTATHAIIAGSIDATNRNVSVSATNAQGTTTTADTTNATVDNIAPTVTAANFNQSGGTGAGGAFRIGDTLAASWNNTAGGDNNSDTIASVTVDFSAWGGSAAAGALDSAGTWSTTYAISSCALTGSSLNLAVTATDDAGNTTTASELVPFEKLPGAFALSSATYSIGEAGGSVTITVNRTGGSDCTAIVEYGTADGTALGTVAGWGTPDFSPQSSTLTFGAGVTTQTFSVPINNDLTAEADESFAVSISNPTGGATLGTPTSATVTITDNDPATITVDDVTVTEGNAGTVNATFTVALSNPSALTVTVDAATADDTATAPADYTAVGTTTLTFNPGETSKTFTVVVNGDTTDEGASEQFFVNLSNATNATIDDGQGAGTITDDDTATLSVDDVTVTEGNAGTVNATFTVALSTASASTVTVDAATVNDTAVAPADFTANAMTLTFNAGDTSKAFTVVVNGDTIDEGASEQFFVNLTNETNATISDAQGVGTITDDDTATLLVDDVTVTEGDAGTVNATFTVALSTASASTVTVDAATADGTATAPADYIAVGTTTLTFNPDETSKTFTVVVNGDTIDEGTSEQLFVNLTNATGAPVGDGQGVGTITDDDTSELTIADVSVTEGGLPAVFTVALSKASTSTVTVDVATADGTAIAPGDYTAIATTTLTFVPGEMSKAVTVQVNDDLIDESAEQFFVNLTNATNAAITDSQGGGTIIDNDKTAIRIGDARVRESTRPAPDQIMTFVVFLSNPSAVTVTVDASTAPATADESDYIPVSETLTFAPGETAKEFFVTIVGDSVVESKEYFNVLLSAAVNATIDRSAGVGSIDDNDSLSLPDPGIVVTGCEFAGESCTLAAVSLSGQDLSSWSIEWSIDGVVRATGPVWNPGFEEAGTYTVELKAANSLGTGRASIQIEIRVPCPAGNLCLQYGRFQIEVMAIDPRTGRTASGFPVGENDLFGYFSFPELTGSVDNPEVFIKVLDGRPVNGNFWVFYGGLTDLALNITVFDVETGEERVYERPGGSSAGGFDVGGGVTPEDCQGEVDGEPLVSVEPEACQAGDDRLCLLGGRFQVTLDARDQRTGTTATGVALPEKDLYGAFAIPVLTGTVDNPEVFVKVLDGRVVNGNFWVFFTGLTDLEYTLTVVDTTTGETKSYMKAAGSACGAFDTDGF